MHPFLNIANLAAREAGKLILKGYDRRAHLHIQEKSPNDFVSEIDLAAEQLLIDAIKTAYPDHSILAEESGAQTETPKAEVQWIIDPLDGTNNFVKGIPHFSISLAVEVNGKIEHGLIYDPVRDEVFTASKGKGAYLNNQRLRVSKTTHLGEALIGTGFPYATTEDAYTMYSELFTTLLPQCADMRRMGSAALDLAYLAAARFDAFFESGLQSWDIAAGALMVKEAGGFISDFAGGENYLTTGNVFAGNPKIYKALVQLLGPTLPSRWRK